MLFLTYFELNEEMAVKERLAVAQQLTASGLFPPPGVTIVRWDQTPDNWGVLLAEADSAASINHAIMIWRAAGIGFFKTTRTAPVTSVQEHMALYDELLKALGTA